MPGGPPENTVRGAGPCPLAPSCVCSEALIWAKMSKASFLGWWTGSGASARLREQRVAAVSSNGVIPGCSGAILSRLPVRSSPPPPPFLDQDLAPIQND